MQHTPRHTAPPPKGQSVLRNGRENRRDTGRHSPRYARLKREPEAEMPLGERGVARHARLGVLPRLRIPAHSYECDDVMKLGDEMSAS